MSVYASSNCTTIEALQSCLPIHAQTGEKIIIRLSSYTKKGLLAMALTLEFGPVLISISLPTGMLIGLVLIKIIIP